MLHVFSTNRVKLMARKPKATDNLGQREYDIMFKSKCFNIFKDNGNLLP